MESAAGDPQLTWRIQTSYLWWYWYDGGGDDIRDSHTNKLARQHMSEFLSALTRGKVQRESLQAKPAGRDSLRVPAELVPSNLCLMHRNATCSLPLINLDRVFLVKIAVSIQ